MAAQTIIGGFWIPRPIDESFGINTSIYALDAANEIVGLVFEADRAGDIEGVEIYVATFTTAPTNGLRASLRAVDMTTGLPSASIGQSATTSAGTPTATGWISFTLDATRTVARGELLAVVFDMPTYSAGNLVLAGGGSFTSNAGFPYSVNGTATKVSSSAPLVAIRYTGGAYGFIRSELWALSAYTSVSFDTADTPDEYGLAVTVPWPCTLEAVALNLRPTPGDPASSYDIVVYDSASTALTTLNVDCDVTSALASQLGQYHRLPTAIALAANTLYRVIVKAVSPTIVVQVQYGVFQSLALMDTIEAGQAWYSTQRFNAGAWTNFNNGTDGYRKARFSLLLNGWDDDVTAGGSSIPVFMNSYRQRSA